MKKIFAFLAILTIGLSFAFAEVPESSSEHKMKICFDISEAFGFSTFPDMPGHNDFNQYYTYKDALEKSSFFKNGELYSRYSQAAWHGAVLAQTYHSNKCTSISSIRDNYEYSYATNSHTKSILRAEMNRLAKKWGLI